MRILSSNVRPGNSPWIVYCADCDATRKGSASSRTNFLGDYLYLLRHQLMDRILTPLRKVGLSDLSPESYKYIKRLANSQGLLRPDHFHAILNACDPAFLEKLECAHDTQHPAASRKKRSRPKYVQIECDSHAFSWPPPEGSIRAWFR